MLQLKLELKLLLLTTVLMSAAVGLAGAATSGLDRPGFDPGVRAQDDLFRAANGAWLQQTEIPPDKSDYGAFIELRDISDQRVRAIVEELAHQPQKPGS